MTAATTFVTHFSGEPAAMTLGAATSATIKTVGKTVVYGRPYALGSNVLLNPDGSRQAIESSLSALDGKFSLVALGARRALLATDLLGCGGAFLRQVDGRTLVASHLGRALSMSRTRPDFDPVGMMAALAGSICVDGRTAFDGVRRLEGGQYALIDLKRGRLEGIYQYGEITDLLDLGPVEPGSPRELAGLLADAVRREQPVDGLFLTAGRDSRAIGACLRGAPVSTPTALTYGGWRSPDRRGSISVARQLGLPHRLLRPLRLDIRPFTPEIVQTAGGLSGLQTSQHVAGAQSAGARVGIAFSGFLGDILSGHPFAVDADAQRELVEKRHTSWVRSNPDVDLGRRGAALLDEVTASLKARLAERRRETPTVAASIIDLTHRQATYISGTFDLMHQHVEVATPFFYRPLLSYLLTRRPEDLHGQRLYDAMLGELVAAEQAPRTGPIGWLAKKMNDRRSSYLTVNWPAIVDRSRGWLRRTLEPHADSLPGSLGLASLDTAAALPMALISTPLVLAASGSPPFEGND